MHIRQKSFFFTNFMTILVDPKFQKVVSNTAKVIYSWDMTQP